MRVRNSQESAGAVAPEDNVQAPWFTSDARRMFMDFVSIRLFLTVFVGKTYTAP